jgi:hypothetical protein
MSHSAQIEAEILEPDSIQLLKVDVVDVVRTSGGIANAHIAIPAVPPATIIAPRFRSAGDEPTGVNIFFVISYAAK